MRNVPKNKIQSINKDLTTEFTVVLYYSPNMRLGFILGLNLKLDYKIMINRTADEEIYMNSTKRIFVNLNKAVVVCLALGFVLCMMTGCGSRERSSGEKLSIVTTLFPQYDFARQIAGDKADVTLLLKPGTEAHDYDPTPADMIKINDADLFIYTGEYMEAWAKNIVNSIDNKELDVLDVSHGITLYKDSGDVGHDHEDNEDIHYHEEHEHEYDPHIWTSPKNAVIMMDNILAEMIRLDPENESYYRENAEKYRAQIEDIDKQLRETVAQAKYDTIYFGGRFALLYFVREYGLNYEAAFDSCSSETEPGTKLVAHMIDEMKKSGAKTVYYEELASPKTAKAIADEVGGRVLLLHSCHNVSAEELKNGATYVSIMRQNLQNLKIGLEQ